MGETRRDMYPFGTFGSCSGYTGDALDWMSAFLLYAKDRPCMLPDFVTPYGFTGQVVHAKGWPKKPMTPTRWSDVVLQLTALPPL